MAHTEIDSMTRPHGAERALAIAGAAVVALLLLFACRGAPLGVPVSDDYLILEHQQFGDFDWLDAHGLAWYWRPAARQLYYALVGPWLVGAPLVAAALHLMLLLATFGGLWVFARRFLPPWGAFAAAAFPLLVEPARTLLGWPSASQHLLAMAGVAVALGAAASGRRLVALAAAAIAMTSLESAVLILLVLPLVAWHEVSARRRWLIGVGALGVAWIALRIWVTARGVMVPDGFSPALLVQVPEVLRRGLAAQLGLEDVPPAFAVAAAALYAGALLAAILTTRSVSRQARWRPHAHDAIVLGGLAWWLVGTAALAGVPDWNAWRSCLPGLGLGVALAIPLARGGAWPAAVFLGLRAGLLLFAPPAPVTVQEDPPDSQSQLSFTRLARLQRTLLATRAALSEPPALRPGARVRYWSFPNLTEVAFGGSAAVRVWFDDPELSWEPFGGSAGFGDTAAVVVAYDCSLPQLAVRIRPDVQRALHAADVAAAEGRLGDADQWLETALALQPQPVGRLRAVTLGNRALLQLRLGALSQADSLHRLSRDIVPAWEWERTEIALALALSDTARAGAQLLEALTRTPDDPELQAVAKLLAAR